MNLHGQPVVTKKDVVIFRSFLSFLLACYCTLQIMLQLAVQALWAPGIGIAATLLVLWAFVSLWRRSAWFLANAKKQKGHRR